MKIFFTLCALFAVLTPISLAANCDVANPARKDCGDIHTTEAGCVAKGCCWRVTTGAPNCFHPADGEVVTNPSNKTDSPINPPGGTKVYIHMMPWFETKASNGGKWGQHWTMANVNPDQMNGDKRKIASKFYPLIDLYASGDPHVIDWQLQLMKLSGVSGVLIDWPGTANIFDYAKNKQNCEAIIAGTARHGLEFAIVYEDHNLGMGRVVRNKLNIKIGLNQFKNLILNLLNQLKRVSNSKIKKSENCF
jgi:hypothetical protein